VNPDTFNAISPYLEDMTMILEEILQEDTDNSKRLRYSLTEISKALGADFSEMGHVSMQNPLCDDCGYEVDLSMVTWG
jgi:predicted Zn-ribbon and HTH transcriptional regulator